MDGVQAMADDADLTAADAEIEALMLKEALRISQPLTGS